MASDLDRDKVVQAVTDAATELTTAEFGAFFYNVINDAGESYTLYTISGVPREAFSKFPMPRNTEVFEPTFKGTGVVRSAGHHQGSALRPQPAAPRHAAWPPAGAELPGRAGQGPFRRRDWRPVLRPLRGRPLRRDPRTPRGRHRVVGVGGARECADVCRGAGGEPAQGRFPGQSVA